MSVPKSRRGESPAEYIDLARKIYVFTYDRVKILSKSHTFYFSLPLYNAAREAYRLVKTANLIYIHNDRDKQNRKELFERSGFITDFSNRRRGYAILHFPPFQVKGH